MAIQLYITKTKEAYENKFRNIFDENQFNELVKAINENRYYEYSNDGFTLKSNSDENSLRIEISYKDNEARAFQREIEELDDDLFVSVCEFLGNDELKRIQECIYSDNIDSVRAGIIKFKKALSTVAKNKIKALSKYA